MTICLINLKSITKSYIKSYYQEEEQNKVSKEELERLQKFTMNNQNKFIRDENELLNGDDDGEDFYGNYEKEAVSKNVKIL
jgi:maltodextrin utilization protein YvdJ